MLGIGGVGAGRRPRCRGVAASREACQRLVATASTGGRPCSPVYHVSGGRRCLWIKCVGFGQGQASNSNEHSRKTAPLRMATGATWRTRHGIVARNRTVHGRGIRNRLQADGRIGRRSRRRRVGCRWILGGTERCPERLSEQQRRRTEAWLLRFGRLGRQDRCVDKCTRSGIRRIGTSRNELGTGKHSSRTGLFRSIHNKVRVSASRNRNYKESALYMVCEKIRRYSYGSPWNYHQVFGDATEIAIRQRRVPAFLRDRVSATA
jgi:hypothetical protein